MGLFSLLFGKPNKPPTRAEMALLVEYANVVEGIGVEELARGVDFVLLPGSKEHLMEIMARVSLSSWTDVALKSDDLPKLYGALAFFFSSEELTLLDEARDIEANILEGLNVSEDDNVTYAEGMSLLSEAHDRLVSAKEDLKVHAASLGSRLRPHNCIYIGKCSNAIQAHRDSGTHLRTGMRNRPQPRA